MTRSQRACMGGIVACMDTYTSLRVAGALAFLWFGYVERYYCERRMELERTEKP